MFRENQGKPMIILVDPICATLENICGKFKIQIKIQIKFQSASVDSTYKKYRIISNLLRQNSHNSVKNSAIAMKLSENTCNKNKSKVIENPVKVFTSSVFIFYFSEGRVNLPFPVQDRAKRNSYKKTAAAYE